MNAYNYPFRHDRTKQILQNFQEHMLLTAEFIAELFGPDPPEDVSVTPLELAQEWLNNLTLILAYLTATKRLSSRQVYGLERQHFEDTLRMVGNIKTYVNKFPGIDLFADDACYQILTRLSIPLKEAKSKEGLYLKTQELHNSLPLRMVVASILVEVDGYNWFYGIYYVRHIYDWMAELDTPVNLMKEESIIPIRVFSDFVEITQAAEVISEICNMKVGNTRDPFLAKFSHDIDGDRNLLEAKLSLFVNKYPCLRSKELSSLGRYLLNYYTLEPLEVINSIGQDVLCIPFTIPESFALTKAEMQELKNDEISEQLFRAFTKAEIQGIENYEIFEQLFRPYDSDDKVPNILF